MNPITYVVGDATRPIGEGPKIIAHCANNLGIWGAGFVLSLSQRWPKPEAVYLERARVSTLRLGDVQFVGAEDGIEVANIIGQEGVGSPDGRPPIRYEALMRGLGQVATRAVDALASVHMPRIGCGLAGGDWAIVSGLVESVLCARPVKVYVYDLPR
jgi:O-acetyl-ADP-ribose deacetylase (regulator of RNase III)